MGQTNSTELRASASQVSGAIISGDLEGVTRLVFAHPEVLTYSLDHERGHNAVHFAVMSKQHGVLAFLLSCATISTKSASHGKREAALKKLAMQVGEG